MATVTHRLSEEIKAKLDAFCDAHGLKQQAVIEDALVAWLENAEDVALVDERRGGPWVEWADVKAKL